MALDLEAIRRRMAELNGTKKSSSVNLWKPPPGEYKIRCLPWKDADPTNPFKERWFYYIGNNPGVLTPKQFGKPDKIDDFIRKLFSSGKKDERELAKKLMPKMRSYSPVIVRGQEDKGVMVWSFGKIIYQRLLGFFLEEDPIDIIDPVQGYDLAIKITQTPGKQFADTQVDPARKSTKLHDDPATVKKWLESVPNLDDMYRLKSAEEIDTILNNWLNSGESIEQGQNDTGTTRGDKQPDALDKLASDVAAAGVTLTSSNVSSQISSSQKKKPQKPIIDDDDSPGGGVSIDAAFADLMADNK